VQLWNRSAADLWGLRDHEVLGSHFLTLDIGFPVEKLKASIRQALSADGQSDELTIEAVNRRGRTFQCRVRAMALHDDAGKGHGVIVLMSEAS
jgi:two-component system, chemotaxis family, CheB/CheR fusion protein